jgi:ABC-type phosphate/phosphonate transport system substrate-binding protein
VTLLIGLIAPGAFGEETRPAARLTLVVMDPLSAPLACDCVQGYAQRKYELLGDFLTRRLGRPVKVFWSESLVRALAEQTEGRADLVIGKHSVVLHDAKQAKRTYTPIASLTGKDGSTTQTGLLVVRAADPAQSVADLKGYRIFFGPDDCDEKSLAPRVLLQRQGVPLPEKLEVYPACSNAATALVELSAEARAAAVISSYAEPLLEGCGTVKKGDLRVIGVSDPVPFITAFVSDALSPSERTAIQAALLDVATEAELLIGLETGLGFVEYEPLPPPGTQPAGDPAVSSTEPSAKKKN